jgi:plastocyanin
VKWTLIPIALTAFVLALTQVVAAPAPKTVKVDDNFFAPRSLTIKKGTTVKFKWVGDDDHNILKARGPGRYFQSGIESGQGVLYKHRFSKPGKYRLFCSLHDPMKMSVEVKRRRS